MQYLLRIFIINIIAFGLISCEKDAPFPPNPSTPTPPPLPPPVTPNPNPGPQAASLRAYAGGAKEATLLDTVNLHGTASSYAASELTFDWKKVSGPAAGVMVKDTFVTRFMQLALGVYYLELTVTNTRGQTAKDTLKLTVLNPPLQGAGEYTAKYTDWDCEIMGCYINVGCLSCKVPKGRPYKVYMKQAGTNNWLEVPHDDFGYFVVNNDLYVYVDEGNTMKYTGDVKIVF